MRLVVGFSLGHPWWGAAQRENTNDRQSQRKTWWRGGSFSATWAPQIQLSHLKATGIKPVDIYSLWHDAFSLTVISSLCGNSSLSKERDAPAPAGFNQNHVTYPIVLLHGSIRHCIVGDFAVVNHLQNGCLLFWWGGLVALVLCISQVLVCTISLGLSALSKIVC